MKFYDSNIPIYASLDQDAVKKEAAQRLLSEGIDAGDVVVSVQVLREYVNCMFKKSELSVGEIAGALGMLRRFPVVRDDEAMLLDAISVKERYGLQFYDACIVAAAKKAGCSEIYSEDMGDGQEYDGVAVVNPFKARAKAKRR